MSPTSNRILEASLRMRYPAIQANGLQKNQEPISLKSDQSFLATPQYTVTMNVGITSKFVQLSAKASKNHADVNNLLEFCRLLKINPPSEKNKLIQNSE